MAETKRGPGRPKGSKNTKTSSKAEEKVIEIQEKNKRDKRVTDEIWAIIIIAIGCFLAVSVFTEGAGEVGKFFNNVLKGLFGAISYVTPIYFIVYGILLIAKRASHFSWKTFFLFFSILLMICTGNSLRFIDAESLWGFRFVPEYYETGILQVSGGAFGMLIGSALLSWLGKVGTWIFIICLSLVALLLILNTPISRFFVKIHDKIEKRKLMKQHEDLYDDTDSDTYKPEEVKSSDRDIKIVTPDVSHFAMEEREEPMASSELIEEDKKNNILKFVTDDDLFGETKKSGSYGLEDSTVQSKGYGIDDDSVNEITSFGVDKKESSLTKTKDNVFDVSEYKDETGSSTRPVSLYKLPSVSILQRPGKGTSISNNILQDNARKLEETLASFNVQAEVVQVTQGPTVTRYELKPHTGVKVSNIESLADDIALALAAKSIRIEAPIPGKSVVGIEIENTVTNMVTLREVIDSNEFKSAKSKLSMALGKDISGTPIIADLKSLPHLLIAGSTGSGKSVCINTIVASLMFKATPDEVRFILIDPKRGVELGKYNGIPYLRTPVVTDAKQAVAALNWAVAEMMNRYDSFAAIGVRDFESYNEKVKLNGEPDKVIPNIVIIIDELADLMSVAKAQIEEAIQRLTQLARAAGMHVILATQRPSVNVITGVIKANVPSRIAFAVSSQTDSRVVLDMIGAEKLVGKGDMLYNPIGISKPIRVQGAFISDDEVFKLIDYSKKQGEKSIENLDPIDFKKAGSIDSGSSSDEDEEYLDEAIEFVVQAGKASTSILQRRFRIGYNRAARLMDIMEDKGIIGPADGNRSREVLLTNEDLEKIEQGE